MASNCETLCTRPWDRFIIKKSYSLRLCWNICRPYSYCSKICYPRITRRLLSTTVNPWISRFSSWESSVFSTLKWAPIFPGLAKSAQYAWLAWNFPRLYETCIGEKVGREGCFETLSLLPIMNKDRIFQNTYNIWRKLWNRLKLSDSSTLTEVFCISLDCLPVYHSLIVDQLTSNCVRTIQ